MKSDLSKTPVDWSAFEQELLEAVYSVLIEKNQRANQKLGTLYDEKEGIWEKYREFSFVEDGDLSKNLLEDENRKIAESNYQIGLARILRVKNSASKLQREHTQNLPLPIRALIKVNKHNAK